MHDVETQLGDYWAELVADYPVPSAFELMAPRVSSIDSAVHSVETEADGPRGDALTFDSDWRVDESTAPEVRKRWIGPLIAVAAAILVVAGVVVVADRDIGGVEPDAPSSPSVTDPPPPPEESAPPLSVVDSLGYRWSRVPHDDAIFGVDSAGVDAVMTDVIAGGPGLVAVGTDGSHYDQVGFAESGALEFGDAAVWTSTDGLTWSRVPHDEEVFGGAAMNGVTTGGPGLVAVGETISGAAVWTSVDGTTWSRVPHDDEVFAGADMTRVTEGGPGLVAVGPSFSEDGAQVWTSADGLTWSRVPDDDEVFGGAGIRDVTAGGPGLVAVGWFADEAAGVAQRAAVWTSVDGLTWSRVPHDEAMFGADARQWMAAVAVGGPGLVAAGWFADEGLYDQGTAVWTSVDGRTWSRVPYDEAVWGYGNVTSVVPVDSGLVAVGADYAPWLRTRADR